MFCVNFDVCCMMLSWFVFINLEIVQECIYFDLSKGKCRLKLFCSFVEDISQFYIGEGCDVNNNVNKFIFFINYYLIEKKKYQFYVLQWGYCSVNVQNKNLFFI